ncbi:MAG: type III pantothenate kinase [Thermogutta sp.]|nr:type III pantothenate kinase [Thermogutta sp.]HOP76671.1 type III pantothenate kinase [Thermogutta sp.]HQF13453.1 type III pantothenate kinase [Thermogutta sp.]
MERMLLVAVDIGNSRIKCGIFYPEGWRRKSPEVNCVFSAGLYDPAWRDFADPLFAAVAEVPRVTWWIASVNRPVTTDFLEILRAARPKDEVMLVSSSDLPLEVAVPHPDRVGIDRLAAAVGANTLRDPNRPAIVVGVGTAVTVNAISKEGVFLGGAISCGAAMSARALHEFTDLLPLIPTEWQTAPESIGKETPSALAAGIFWGLVGTVRELIERQTEVLQGPPEVFLTGGGAKPLVGHLGDDVRFVENLTLIGIAAAARAVLDKG